MAPTGAAAYNIGGMTWQSALGCEIVEKKGGGGNLMSNERAVKFGEYLRSVKLIILDEVSMVSLQSLQEISQRIVEALCTLQENYAVRSEIKAAPFGGIHIIFCGDLYQLKCVTGSSITNVTKQGLDAKAVTGRDLWFTLNRYLNFTVSTRYEGHTGADLDRFLKDARVGMPDTTYIDRLNARMCITVEEAMRKTNPKAMWMASTHKEVTKINDYMYSDLVKRGNFAYDVVAHHTISKERGNKVCREDRKRLFQITKWTFGKKKSEVPGVLRLAVGSRVKLTENIATQLGLYNGARGTVYKFIFSGKCPLPVLPNVQKAYNWYNREIPIVLVQMDQDLGALTCVPGVRNIIPIDSKSYKNEGNTRIQLPLLPAHASTIHSAQGLTAEFGVVLQPSKGTPFAYGLEYVGCSRAKSMDELQILKYPLRVRHFNYDQTSMGKIRREYDRLERTVGIL